MLVSSGVLIPIVTHFYNEILHTLSPIVTKWSLNFCGGMPLVKGSTNMTSVLTCSMTTFLSLTRSRSARYLMSICFLWLPLLLFLAIKTAVELSQYNLNILDIESTILSPEIKFFNHTPCEVASKQETNSASIMEVVTRILEINLRYLDFYLNEF